MDANLRAHPMCSTLWASICRLGADSTERIRIMLETVEDHLRTHDKNIRKLQSELSAEALQARTDTLKELILDGAARCWR